MTAEPEQLEPECRKDVDSGERIRNLLLGLTSDLVARTSRSTGGAGPDPADEAADPPS